MRSLAAATRACPSASSCVAVGDYQDASSGGGLIETWSGSAWSEAVAPLPPADLGGQPQRGSLTSIACPSASTCVANGNYTEYFPSTGEGFGRGMVLTESGNTWTAVQPPLPPTGQAGSAGFGGGPSGTVACPSAAWCTVVGIYYDTSVSADQGLLLTWSGGAWTAQAPAPPGNTFVNPLAVACPAVSSCTVIGYYDNSSGNPNALIVTGAGAAWTSTSIATNLLFSVACPSVAACVAGATGAVYTGSGTTWRPIAAPGPTQGDLLGAVACPPGTPPCAIAAQSGELTGLQIVAGAAANWAGFDVPPPAPIGSGAFFNAITCPSAATCVAVGTINHQGVIATGPS